MGKRGSKSNKRSSASARFSNSTKKRRDADPGFGGEDDLDDQIDTCVVLKLKFFIDISFYGLHINVFLSAIFFCLSS